ncbi:MAG: hypothetical protein ACRCUT_07520, partial [Spirochaetota bacterium]
MYPIEGKIKEHIDRTLAKEGEVVIVAYSLLEKTENIIKYILYTTFQKHKKDDLLDPVFSSIKELTTNAIKANIKKVLIDEGTIGNPDDPLAIVKGIKSVLNEKSLLEYGLRCREHNLSMRLHLNIDNEKIVAKVIDPLPLSDEQLERMQKKIERAKGYENLAMCYLENPDPLAEGMGLGLSMIVVLLKGSGIDPSNFTITSDAQAQKTIARISIP